MRYSYKVAIAHIHDVNYQALADATLPNKVEYCKRHGMDLITRTEGFTYSGKQIGFEKIKLIQDIFNHRNDLDYVWWLGCDTMITNMNIHPDTIINTDYDFIVTADGNGINVDSFLIKDSLIGRGFIDYILQVAPSYEHHFWYEQQAIIDFYHNVPLARTYMQVLPQRVMNSYLYDEYPEWRVKPQIDHTGHDGNWQKGDFVLQLPGIPNIRRIELFKEIEKDIVR